MKNKKYLLIILGIIMVILPFKVDADNLTFGSPTSSGTTTKIPVVVEKSNGASEAKVNCDSGRDGVTCKVEPNSKNEHVDATKEGNAYLIKTINYEYGEQFENGDIIAYLIVTNTTSEEQKNVSIRFKDTSIGGTAVTDSKEYTIAGPKTTAPQTTTKKISSNPKFQSIKFSQGLMTPEFNPDVTEYNITGIADTINSVRVTTACQETGCSYSVEGGKATNGSQVTLNQGENTIKVTGTSEDGQTITYTFKVYRGKTTFNSAKLGTLTFGDYILTPAFDPEVKEYTVKIPSTIKTLTNILSYKTEDENANVDIKGLDNLIEGENEVTIVVDNANGDETITYTIKVIKMSGDDIEVLKYINNEVVFRTADGEQVALKIDEFKLQYPEEYKKIINEEYKFDKDGNIIVEAEDTSSSKEDKKEKKKSKVWLIILLIVLGLAIIGGSGYFIFRKEKPKDDKKKKKGKKDKDNDKDEEEKVDSDKEENENNEESTSTEDKETDESESLEEKVEKVVIDEDIPEEDIENEVIKNFSGIDDDTTMEIDEALSDLMSTKKYNFDEED